MGKLIIFPTDTVYGIGCSIWDRENIKKIYELKHRSYDKPLACLCASLEQIEQIAYVDQRARQLIEKFLPGALTLILKTKPAVAEAIGYQTIGVRIPDCKEAVAVLEEYGPMLTTSVNESGQQEMNSYEDIKKCYGGQVDLILPPTAHSSSIASTVLWLVDKELKLLREGSITLRMIKEAIDV